VLLKNPVALLLDEATANLDEASQARIVATIGDRFRQRTVLSVSHRLQTIMDFDEVLVVDRGRIVQHGPPARLAAESGLFQQLLSQQTAPAADARSGETQAAEPPAVPAGGAALPAASPPPHSPEEGGPGEAIRRCTLFANLDGDQVAALERMADVVECSAGNVLFQRGDPGDSLFLICRGTVEFLAPRRGNQGDALDVVDTYGPYQAFGNWPSLATVCGPSVHGRRPMSAWCV